jgi:hypothetical protein
MIQILKTYIGATRKTLCVETARVYGFASTGPAIAAQLNEAFEILLRGKVIEETDGKLSLNGPTRRDYSRGTYYNA